MALNESIRGGINGYGLLFSVYEKRSPDLGDYASRLGMVVHVKLEGGESVAMLVQAGETVAKPDEAGGLCFKWSDTLAYEVVLTEAINDEVACGFSFPGLEALEPGDYFWIIVPGLGSPRITLIGNENVVKGEYLTHHTSGRVVPVTGPESGEVNPNIVVGQALTTSVAPSNVVDVLLGFVKGVVDP